jgi:hypothetical protein
MSYGSHQERKSIDHLSCSLFGYQGHLLDYMGNHNLSVLVEFIPTLKEIHAFAIMQASIILSHILSASKNVVPGLTAKTTFESVAIVFDNY